MGRKYWILGAVAIAFAVENRCMMVYGEDGVKQYSDVTLRMLSANEQVLDGVRAVIDAAEQRYGFRIELDVVGSGGGEYNQLVETRLASGKMDDLMIYNSGALFQQLCPEEYFVDISEDAVLMNRLSDDFIRSVSLDGKTFGIPYDCAQVGGVLYNREMYRKYGLEIPHTWEAFLENCRVLQEAGETAIIGAYADQWPEIVTMLGDFYNVYTENPGIEEKMVNGEENFSSIPEFLDSIRKCREIVPFLNDDYMFVKYGEGYRRFAEGKGCHFIMLSQVLANISAEYGDEIVDKIGIFGIPGNMETNHGLTLWLPNGIYVNKDSENKEAALDFLRFYVSDEGLELYAQKTEQVGPYCIEGYKRFSDCSQAVLEDIQAYVEEGKTCPALEFLSPLYVGKTGGLLEFIMGEETVEEVAHEFDEGLEEAAFKQGLDWAH